MPDTPDKEDTTSGGSGGTGGGNSNIGAGKGPVLRNDPPISKEPSGPGEMRHAQREMYRRQAQGSESTVPKRQNLLESHEKSWVSRVQEQRSPSVSSEKGEGYER